MCPYTTKATVHKKPIPFFVWCHYILAENRILHETNIFSCEFVNRTRKMRRCRNGMYLFCVAFAAELLFSSCSFIWSFHLYGFHGALRTLRYFANFYYNIYTTSNRFVRNINHQKMHIKIWKCLVVFTRKKCHYYVLCDWCDGRVLAVDAQPISPAPLRHRPR